MARTRQDVEIAARVGRSAGTVERHRLQGMWPADPTAPIERHYEVMDECGLGSGRDNWAVAVDAAERFRWPVAMLRSVLADPPPVDGVRLAARIRPLVVAIASLYRGPLPVGHGAADVAEAIVDDAYDAVGKVVRKERTETEDFEDLAEIVATTADRAVEVDDIADEGVPTDRPLRADVRQEVMALVERMASWRPWARQAVPAELAGAVVLGGRVVDLLNAITPSSAVQGDERRTEVACLAPWCGAELVPAGVDRLLPTIERLIAPPSSPALSLDSPPDRT